MTDSPSVLVAMSGGVDSSTAAALLQQQGYNCTGVFMCLGQSQSDDNSSSSARCCSPEAARDAQTVAQQLGIDLEVVDFQEDMAGIIRYFIKEYRQARTPNPCVFCNTRLKFGKLMEFAEMLDVDYVATGHYARIGSVGGQWRLSRAGHVEKDQSYALFGVARKDLSRILLPLGEHIKNEVRQIAREMNLPIHDKAESQEICFIPDDDYVRFLAERAPELCRPGPVVDTQGRQLGEHQGIFRYTVGQRRGLGIALGEPAYVVRLDADSNTVVLGSDEDLLSDRLVAEQVNWLIDPIPDEPFPAIVQIRYNHRGAAAEVKPLIDQNGQVTRVEVTFEKPVRAITPGQAAVFYDDQTVLGGGWIDDA